MNLSRNFLSHFSCIIDPRKETHNKKHRLSDILVLTILATLCGAESWTDVEEFGEAKEEWLKTFLDLPHGIPSHDTIGDLYARLSPTQLQQGFLSWIHSIVEVHGGVESKRYIGQQVSTERRYYITSILASHFRERLRTRLRLRNSIAQTKLFL